jgi:hypothetical protein
MLKVDSSEKKIENENKIENEIEIKYLTQLTPLEKHALEIAKRQLKTSFDLEKSIGFLKFK